VERWGAETDLAAGLFREAGVELCLLPDPTTGGRP
jgi:hypothetical protein